MIALRYETVASQGRSAFPHFLFFKVNDEEKGKKNSGKKRKAIVKM